MSGSRNRFAVTLVELLVVLMLMGLIAGLAVIRLSGVTRRAKLERAVGIVVYADTGSREFAAKTGTTAAICFDVTNGSLKRLIADKSRAREVAIGEGVSIGRVVSTTRDISAGTTTVDYSTVGASETYAVELETTGGASAWILFAGLTGQVTRLKGARDVEAILKTLR